MATSTFFVSVSIEVPTNTTTIQNNLTAVFGAQPFVVAVDPVKGTAQVNFQMVDVDAPTALTNGQNLFRQSGIYMLGAMSKPM